MPFVTILKLQCKVGAKMISFEVSIKMGSIEVRKRLQARFDGV